MEPLEASGGGSLDPSATLNRVAVDLNARNKGTLTTVKGHRVAFYRYQLSPLKKLSDDQVL